MKSKEVARRQLSTRGIRRRPGSAVMGNDSHVPWVTWAGPISMWPVGVGKYFFWGGRLRYIVFAEASDNLIATYHVMLPRDRVTICAGADASSVVATLFFCTGAATCSLEGGATAWQAGLLN